MAIIWIDSTEVDQLSDFWIKIDIQLHYLNLKTWTEPLRIKTYDSRKKSSQKITIHHASLIKMITTTDRWGEEKRTIFA